MSEHRRLTIDGFVIHDGSDCYVIAEIGHNHQGSVEQAKATERRSSSVATTTSSCSATRARSG